MRKLMVLIPLFVLVISVIAVKAYGGVNTSYIPFTVVDNCDPWPTDTPAGALPNQPPPVFCMIDNYGPGTEQSGQNSWYDDFNHGLSFASFDGAQYQVFNEIGAWRTIFWRHADHWMVDLAPNSPNGSAIQGYALLRPNQSFNFINDKIVVETTVAAGMEAYSTDAWTEIVISNGPAPNENYLGLYSYDLFPEHYTVGCRLQSSRKPVCALKSNNGNPTSSSSRIWEMSWFQDVGTYTYGGYPSNGLEYLWNVCEVDEPDTVCRDRFRLELSKTSLKLFVNGELYFEQSGIPPLPNELLNEDVYVYLASSHVKHSADTIRYHWDDFLVNPDQSATNKQSISIGAQNESVCSRPSSKTSNVGLSHNRLLLPPT